MAVNKVLLIGKLGKDPELSYTPKGAAVCKLSIATTERWQSDGHTKEKTEWHSVVAWNRLGEVAGKYLKKGSQVYVEGRLQTRSWEAQDGNKRYVTEVVAQNVQFLDSPKTKEPSAYDTASIPDDQIPF